MNVIYRDDTIAVTRESDGYYIETFKRGRSPESFYVLMRQFPFIVITNFQTIRNALSEAPYGPELFGINKEPVTIEISDDQLEAYITLNVPPDDLLVEEKRRALLNKVADALKKARVTYGIISEALHGYLPANKPILIARGTAPVHGKDSVIKMYKIDQPKPKVIDNGSVNFYDLSLIHQVRAGDWVGERIDPIAGVPGKNIYGDEIPPNNGITLPLNYDRNSVELVREDGKDVLYALKTGAVHYDKDCISVYDHLEIDGDIDFSTGNIDFDGYVSIRGSVEENFSVRATKDIEISGEYGLGGVNTIESLDGNIYIRGGIAGKGKARVICKKNLYVKFLSDVEVICEGSVYIGFYARNSFIHAKQVVIHSPKGQIVGGVTDVDIKVECANIGNRLETRTQIIVRGFDRNIMQGRMKEISSLIEEKKERFAKLTAAMKKTEGRSNKTENTFMAKTRQELWQVQEQIKSLENEQADIANFLKTPGDGAVMVKKRIYPKVRLVIRGEVIEIIEQAMAPAYVLYDGKVSVM